MEKWKISKPLSRSNMSFSYLFHQSTCMRQKLGLEMKLNGGKRRVFRIFELKVKPVYASLPIAHS